MPGATPILRLSRIEKSFPGVMALRSADLEIHAGEIHALVGENGAGKSTLIKIMTGAHAPDRGTPALDGNPTRFHDPLDAFRAGVAAIYQEFNLVPGLSARENLFLGRESVRAGVIDEAEERARAGPALRRLGAAFDPEDPVRNLNIAEQQLVEIARAILADTRILIMDEPTAALAPREVEILFNILSALRERGHGILFVSHRLAEVRRIADRITVMRDGATLGTWAAADMTADRMIELMVGRPLPATEKGSDRVPGSTGPEVLAVRNLSAGRVRGVSFTLNAGEVLGLAGLVGAGRTEVVRLLFGADPPREGTILMNGRAIVNRSPRDAIRHGICLLTEDRKGLGLVLGLSARDNFSLPSLRRWSRWGWIDEGREEAAFLRHVKSLRIKIAGPEQPAAHLSGGNQQKLLVARWLENESRVVLFDEPTRGIDVGARFEMCGLIRELAAKGKAVLVISSDLSEILSLSDRILVMRDGRITGEIHDAGSATQEQVLRLAVS